MPRVVDDQRHKFYNDELFRKLSRESEVRHRHTHTHTHTHTSTGRLYTIDM